MSKTFTKTQKLDISGINGLDPVTVVNPIVAEYNIDLDTQLSSPDQKVIEVAIPVDQLVSFVATVTTNDVAEGLTIVTNDLDTPDDVITLKSSYPVMWQSTDNGDPLFTVDIAMLGIVNIGLTPVNVKIRALLVATD